MVAYLLKFDASEGFNQIIDFLNESSIKYALTVNLNIYVSCIKQFWTTFTVKKVNDVMRLQALVDKKKVMITEASISDALHLDDAKALPKYTSPALTQVGDLSTHTTKYTSPALTQKVFNNIRWVCKGFSRVETPLFKGMIVEQQVAEGDADEVHGEDVNATGVGTEGVVSATDDVVPTINEEPSILSPTPPTPPPQPSQDIPLTSKMIADMDVYTDVVLEETKDVVDDIVKDVQDADVEETTPLALKAPVVDYEIHNENNRPYYKIKRANDSQQLYLSFLSLHKNVDRENLEALWRSIKERFATTKPKNLFDDFLLITLEEMFKKPDIHAQI
nr:hypothetical protein [Tanacetum cinerariifolium]